MFCPKCGNGNPDDGKFCRSCGTDLGNVSAALSGDLPATVNSGASCSDRERRRRNDPNELFADSIRRIVFGFGFIVISAALFLTNVAGGRAWWWAMLFPAFSFLARGISDNVKANRMERRRAAAPPPQPLLNHSTTGPGLPASRTEYVSPGESRYKTDGLVPPSVTENTTRHLERNPDDEMVRLPRN